MTLEIQRCLDVVIKQNVSQLYNMCKSDHNSDPSKLKQTTQRKFQSVKIEERK